MLFVDEVVSLVLSISDLQLALGQFAARMRINTSKSEAMVLGQKKVDCPLQLVDDLLPHVKDFLISWGLFLKWGKNGAGDW